MEWHGKGGFKWIEDARDAVRRALGVSWGELASLEVEVDYPTICDREDLGHGWITREIYTDWDENQYFVIVERQKWEDYREDIGGEPVK
jgi:hypothetical protein